MNRNKVLYLSVFGLACASLMCLSCAEIGISVPAHHPQVAKGPPPHAPAHGYRAKQADGAELVFDSDLGLYVVVGMPDYYYFDGCYFRFYHNCWQTSIHIDSGWKAAPEKSVPPGLAKVKGKEKHKFMSKGKGHLK